MKLKDVAKKEKKDNYQPYGKEWEKEMMKLTRKQLVDFLRNILKEQHG